MRAISLFVFAGALVASTPSAALPLRYEFSAVSRFFYQGSEPQQGVSDAVRANPESGGFSGSFSYDADSGITTLSLAAPVFGTTPAIDLGGVAPASGLQNADVLAAQYPHAYGGYFLSDYLGGMVVRSGSESALHLVGTGLRAGGALPHGLAVGDLLEAYVSVQVVYVDAPFSAYSVGCPTDFSLVECANAGYQHYLDGGTAIFAMTELQEIAEPPLAMFALLPLAFALVRRHAPRAE